MTKLLVVSDPQFHDWQSYCLPSVDGVNWRLRGILSAMDDAVRIGLENGCTDLVIPGDIWEDGSRANTSAMVPVVDWFAGLKKRGLKTHLLVGNHDQVSRDGKLHGLRVLAHIPGVTVYDRVTVGKLWGRRVAWVPHGMDLPDAQGDLLFGHVGVTEAAGAALSARDTGAVPMRAFKDWRLAIVGHYHSGQFIRDVDGPERVVIPGNVCQRSVDEAGNVCRAIVMDPTDLAVIQSFPVAGPHFRRFSLPDDLDELRAVVASPKPWLMVRVESTDPVIRRDFVADLWAAMGHPPVPYTFAPCRVAAPVTRAPVDTDGTLDGYVRAFVAAVPPGGNMDAKRCLDVGLRYLGEVAK